MNVSRSSIGVGGAAATVREASFADPANLDQGFARARLCLLGIVGGTALALDLPSGDRVGAASSKVGRCTVGRSAEADMAVAHPTISRVHAAFYISSDSRDVLRCEVEDLGSLNGTRVGGRRLTANERVDVGVGETVELGSTSFVLQRRVSTGDVPAARYPSVPSVLVGSSPTARGPSLQVEIDELERDRILQALDTCGGNQSRAAKMLGMNRGTLIRRLESYGVPRPRK